MGPILAFYRNVLPISSGTMIYCIEQNQHNILLAENEILYVLVFLYPPPLYLSLIPLSQDTGREYYQHCPVSQMEGVCSCLFCHGNWEFSAQSVRRNISRSAQHSPAVFGRCDREQRH